MMPFPFFMADLNFQMWALSVVGEFTKPNINVPVTIQTFCWGLHRQPTQHTAISITFVFLIHKTKFVEGILRFPTSTFQF